MSVRLISQCKTFIFRIFNFKSHVLDSATAVDFVGLIYLLILAVSNRRLDVIALADSLRPVCRFCEPTHLKCHYQLLIVPLDDKLQCTSGPLKAEHPLTNKLLTHTPTRRTSLHVFLHLGNYSSFDLSTTITNF